MASELISDRILEPRFILFGHSFSDILVPDKQSISLTYTSVLYDSLIWICTTKVVDHVWVVLTSKLGQEQILRSKNYKSVSVYGLSRWLLEDLHQWVNYLVQLPVLDDFERLNDIGGLDTCV